jgi:hypothetical protein
MIVRLPEAKLPRTKEEVGDALVRLSLNHVGVLQLREKGGGGERERERGRESARERERESVCVLCVRERGCVCVWQHTRVTNDRVRARHQRPCSCALGNRLIPNPSPEPYNLIPTLNP